MDANIASLRLNYKRASLNEADIDASPITQFKNWFAEALNSKLDEPNAFVLSTIKNNAPQSRVVLLKDITTEGFVFFTNYDSNKGLQISENNNVSMNFLWHGLERQVRINGIASKISEAESAIYFNSRPRQSQLGAIASKQSSIIPNRQYLENTFAALEKKYENITITKPENWGGYLIIPTLLEFWQGCESRLHDRLQYTLSNENWVVDRLSP
jgi:pyridoxamine 5'-phosphate oxidase